MSSIAHQKYVCGFLFTSGLSSVVLLEKKKGPPKLIGCLNGLGGKVHEKETPKEAMHREFLEEAGIEFHGWLQFCTLVWHGGLCTFFTGRSEHASHRLRTLLPKENDAKEPIYLTQWTQTINTFTPAMLDWLVPMAHARLVQPERANWPLLIQEGIR